MSASPQRVVARPMRPRVARAPAPDADALSVGSAARAPAPWWTEALELRDSDDASRGNGALAVRGGRLVWAESGAPVAIESVDRPSVVRALVMHVQRALLRECLMNEVILPYEARPREAITTVWMSVNAMSCNVLLILVPGPLSSGMGLWTVEGPLRGTISDGSMLSMVKAAAQREFGVIIANPYRTHAETCSIRGSETPDRHVCTLYETFVHRSMAKMVVFVAHSFGCSAVSTALGRIARDTESSPPACAACYIDPLQKEDLRWTNGEPNFASQWHWNRPEESGSPLIDALSPASPSAHRHRSTASPTAPRSAASPTVRASPAGRRLLPGARASPPATASPARSPAAATPDAALSPSDSPPESSLRDHVPVCVWVTSSRPLGSEIPLQDDRGVARSSGSDLPSLAPCAAVPDIMRHVATLERELRAAAAAAGPGAV